MMPSSAQMALAGKCPSLAFPLSADPCTRRMPATFPFHPQHCRLHSAHLLVVLQLLYIDLCLDILAGLVSGQQAQVLLQRCNPGVQQLPAALGQQLPRPRAQALAKALRGLLHPEQLLCAGALLQQQAARGDPLLSGCGPVQELTQMLHVRAGLAPGLRAACKTPEACPCTELHACGHGGPGRVQRVSWRGQHGRLVPASQSWGGGATAPQRAG